MDLELYKQMFVRDFAGPFAVQAPEQKWHTRRHFLSDASLRDHLDGEYWIGTRGCWYPPTACLDFDFSHETPRQRGEIIGRALDLLQMGSHQYYIMTSPSFERDGSCHLIFRPQYRDAPATLNLMTNALRGALGNLCEIYPQKRRCFRLPFGRSQYLVGDGDRILYDLSWQQALHYVCKLETYEISFLNFAAGETAERGQGLGRQSGKMQCKPELRELPAQIQLKESEALLLAGLQSAHSRHFAQWKLISYFYRHNWIPDETNTQVKTWIRKKHNGYSHAVNCNQWREIDAEIDRQTDWIYSNSKILPDAVHNLNARIAAPDLELAAEIYRGDAVNQKRLVDLLAYCRPRSHHEWIFIPYREWTRIANKNAYRGFIRELERRNIIVPDWNYRHDPQNKKNGFCRKFKLKICLRDAPPIQRDARNVTDFYDAHLALSANNVRLAAERCGLTPQRFYHYLKNSRTGRAETF